ncbi:DUF4340 domain-containing protein [Verrucomicrobiota bacterium]
MKTKHLLILVVLATVLGGWAYWSSRNRNKPASSLAGTKLLPDLPVNEVCKIVITSHGSTTVVAKTEGTWSVPGRYGYPADFDKICDTIRDISELTVGQVMPVSRDEWSNFNLLSPTRPPGQTVPDDSGNTGSLLELMDDQDQVLASLVVGKTFMRRPVSRPPTSKMDFGGYPDGQYVRRNDDVFLISKTLDQLTENVNTWLDNEFINVPAADIREITITGPDRTPIKLMRDADSNELKLEGIRDDEESAETSKISQIAGALRYLSFHDVASPDLTPEETGLDTPVIFTARTKQGQTYLLRIGSNVANGPPGRYIRASVAYEALTQDRKPSDEQCAKETKTLNDKLSGWIYIIKPYLADRLLLKREDIIKKKEEPEVETQHSPGKPTQT